MKAKTDSIVHFQNSKTAEGVGFEFLNQLSVETNKRSGKQRRNFLRLGSKIDLEKSSATK